LYTSLGFPRISPLTALGITLSYATNTYVFKGWNFVASPQQAMIRSLGDFQ